MNDKLRELETFCEGKFVLLADVEKLINTPKHETVEAEMKCPKCNSDMKEYFNSYGCRNLACRIKIKKYFKVKE